MTWQGRFVLLGAAAQLLGGCTSFHDQHRPPNLIIRADATPSEVVREERRRLRKMPDGRFAPELQQDEPATAGSSDAVASGIEPAQDMRPDDAKAAKRRLRYTPVSMFVASYDAAAQAFEVPSLAYLRGETAQRMTRLGMNLIETRCDLFFEAIGRGAQSADFARREAEIITTALVAALGLAGASQGVVTAAGIGGGLVTQTIDAYGNVFFFSPDVGLVQQLVQEKFASTRRHVFLPENTPQDYDQALSYLRAHQNVCTAQEIKALVNDAVRNGKPVARFGTTQTPAEEATASVLKQLATQWAAPAISLDQAALMSLALRTPAPSIGAQQVICTALQEQYRDKLCAGKLGAGRLRGAADTARASADAAFDYLDKQPAGALREAAKRAEEWIEPIATKIEQQQGKIDSMTNENARAEVRRIAEEATRRSAGAPASVTPAAPQAPSGPVIVPPVVSTMQPPQATPPATPF